MTNKERFDSILIDRCYNRFNVPEFIKYLETKTDFYTAPASTRYHLNCEGGLLKHSLNVYETLDNMCTLYGEEIDKSSIAICGLLHDLCKVNFYKQELKNVKVNGHWTTQLGYCVDDSFPIGHGEKSVIMLQRHMKLTDEEIASIRWHMGGFDSAVRGGDMSANQAADKYKLVTLLQVADLISSRILEGEN